jgi:hypothetical protein
VQHGGNADAADRPSRALEASVYGAHLGVDPPECSFTRMPQPPPKRRDSAKRTEPSPAEQQTMDDGDCQHRRPPGWRGKLTALLVTFAGGMAVNDLSSTLGYRGLAGVLAIFGVVAAATWIRQLDAGAWLSRRASRLFLTPAAAVAVAAAFSPGPSAGILTAVAAILTAGAVLVATELETAVELLSRAALGGAGVAFIGIGMTLLTSRHVLAGTMFIALGVTFIGTGVALLADRQALIGAAVMANGMAFIMLGVALAADQHVVGIALIGTGVAFIGDGMALLVDRPVLGYATVIASGLAVIGTGVALLVIRQAPVGVAVILLGAGVVGTGVALLADRHVLSFATVIASG